MSEVHVIYSKPKVNIIWALVLLGDFLVLFMLIIASLIDFRILIMILTIMFVIDLIVWFIFRMYTNRIKRFIRLSQKFAGSINILDNYIALDRTMLVSKGKLVISSIPSYNYMARRGSRKFDVRFEMLEEPKYINKLEFLKLSDFTYIKKGLFYVFEIPAWRIEDPELMRGNHFILVVPIQPTMFEDVDGSVDLSHQDDFANFKYRISERTLECEIYYSPNSASPSTKKAEVYTIFLDTVRLKLGEVNEAYAKKSFKVDLLPNLKSKKVLIIYPSALKLGYQIGSWDEFFAQIKQALAIPENSETMTSREITLEFVLKRSFGRRISRREQIKLRVK